MVELKNVTVKQLKAACDLINNEEGLRLANDPIRIGPKATKAKIADILLEAITQIGKAGKLDDVPADAWDTYRAMVPKGGEGDNGDAKAGVVELNFDDTPEGKAAKAKGNGKGKATGKDSKPAPKPKRETKAVAFWKVINTQSHWDKKGLAEALRKAHGNGSEPEAKFWTQNYLNLLETMGVVSISGQEVVVIEK